MTSTRKLSSLDNVSIAPLVRLLRDAVHGGASVGFLAPLTHDSALNYWQHVSENLNRNIHLWIAECEGEIVGSVQLEVCGKENGQHRAEVQKLFVLQSHRGRGISSLLMRAVEEFAASRGRTLLVLDTEAGSFAESVYRHLGWKAVGQIPGYATSPNGELHATAYFYKEILKA